MGRHRLMHRNLQCVTAMRTAPRVVATALSLFSLLVFTACGSFTTVSTPSSAQAAASLTPVIRLSPSPEPAPAPAPAPAPTHSIGPDVPAGLTPTPEVITGSVGPLPDGAPPCYLERYNCQKYDFTMQKDGAVEVTLTWQGGSRAMLIQLYRAGAGLVHEDLAPVNGPPQISFRRTDITPMDYELRVVNMEPAATHPFTLDLTTWQ